MAAMNIRTAGPAEFVLAQLAQANERVRAHTKPTQRQRLWAAIHEALRNLPDQNSLTSMSMAMPKFQNALDEAERLLAKWKMPTASDISLLDFIDSSHKEAPGPTRNLLILFAGLSQSTSPAVRFWERFEQEWPTLELEFRDVARKWKKKSTGRRSAHHTKSDSEAKRRTLEVACDPRGDIMKQLLKGDSSPFNCLDALLTGDQVKMLSLQMLFGIERHRLGRLIPASLKGRCGKNSAYDYRVLTRITSALLRESPRNPNAWLPDTNLRSRLLDAIEQRVLQLQPSPEIVRSVRSALKSCKRHSGKRKIFSE